MTKTDQKTEPTEAPAAKGPIVGVSLGGPVDLAALTAACERLGVAVPEIHRVTVENNEGSPAEKPEAVEIINPWL